MPDRRFLEELARQKVGEQPRPGVLVGDWLIPIFPIALGGVRMRHPVGLGFAPTKQAVDPEINDISMRSQPV